MKKRIVFSLLLMFAIFAAGSAALVAQISGITGSLGRLIRLHQVEHLRHDLVIRIQTVQGDLYRVRTPLAADLDGIVANVAALDRAAAGCEGCHHVPGVSARFKEIRARVEEYKDALSFYITAAANPVRIDDLRRDAVVVGDRLLSLTQEITHAATRSLQRATAAALGRMDRIRGILYVTLGVASAFALVAGLYLVRYLMRPVHALLSATRALQAGDMGHTVAYADSTEFGELARDFNSMSFALKEGYERLASQQEAVRESESKFRTLSEYSFDWEYWVGPGGEMVYVSPACAEVTGYAAADFVRDPGLAARIVHPEDRAAFDEHLGNGGAERHREMEFRIVTRSGAERWVSHVCGPIVRDGETLGRFASNRDVSDRKRLEEQLAQTSKMESLGLLAGGVAHDFNNLLTAILGYSSLLEERLAGDERNAKALAQISRAAERAKELTGGLLAFSRKQIMRPRVQDLNAVVSGVAPLLERLVGEEIEVRVAPAEGPLPALVDAGQVDHVLINLVTNARDALGGGGELEIRTGAAEVGDGEAPPKSAGPGHYVWVSVRDSGSGIDPAALQRIFEPFYTTKEKGKGTGLGLSQALGIVEQHGGWIAVDSRPGHGSSFEVYLPRADGRPEEAPEAPPPAAEPGSGGGETILVAEDDESVRGFLEEVLTGSGYRTVLARDGEEAIRRYEELRGTIDLVLLDVIMPRKNGKEVYDHIKTFDPRMRVVFMTGYTKDVLSSRGIYDEGLEVLPKPLTVAGLLGQLRRSLAAGR